MTLTKEQIEYWRKAEARTDFEREMALIAESVMPESEPALPCELMVGNGHFHTGVKIATAQEAINRMFSRLQSLEQELERARKDAERYRWLKPRFRSGGSITDGPLNARRVRYTFNAVDPFLTEHKDIDAAIDTARRTSGDERG